MDRDRDDKTDAFRDRMQNRNLRKRSHLDENHAERDANDSGQTRPPKRRHDESSGLDEGNGSGGSALNGIDMGMIPTWTPQPYPRTSLTGAARDEFSPLAISNALFASSLYPSNFLLQQQMQQIRQEQQQMQLVLNGFAMSGGFGSYDRQFSGRMNDPCATVTESHDGASSSSLPPFATIDPSVLQFGQRTSLSSLSSVTGLPVTFTNPPITTEHDWSRRAPSLLSASTTQCPLGGLQPVAASLRSPTPSCNTPLHTTIPRTEELYTSRDDKFLSDFQIVIRKQIEFFVAQQKDIDSFTPGRRKEISVGQVGIRCRHCTILPAKELPRGAVYFPSTLRALYQAAQNMATDHFANNKCKHISPQIKNQLIDLKEKNAISCLGHGGRKYWAEGAVARGINETDRGLRFRG